MKILSIDTASDICGVSLVEDKKLLCCLDVHTGRTHSENLMPMIASGLEKTNLSLQDIDLMVCDIGPGSFTGIRIGIATVMAFRDSLHIPCVGISSLESLCYKANMLPHQDISFVCSMIDSKNENCYFALYQLEGTSYSCLLKPTSSTVTDALQAIKTSTKSCSSASILFIGDGALAYRKNIASSFSHCTILEEPEHHTLNSYALALAGLEQYMRSGETSILPLYLKKPQAQRQLEERTPVISKMQLEDLKKIADCLEAEFDNFWTYDVLQNELSCDTSTYFVAKLENQIVGFAGYKTILEEAELMNIVVRKSARGTGIASLLMKHIFSALNSQNIHTLYLEVASHNLPAIHLYQKFGFMPIGTRKGYYQNSDAILMQCHIL